MMITEFGKWPFWGMQYREDYYSEIYNAALSAEMGLWACQSAAFPEGKQGPKGHSAARTLLLPLFSASYIYLSIYIYVYQASSVFLSMHPADSVSPMCIVYVKSCRYISGTPSLLYDPPQYW